MQAQKPLTKWQKFKAPFRQTLIYQAIFHPFRSAKRLKKYIGERELRKKLKAMNEDERFCFLRHREIFGYEADFRHPRTFNEKIIHRMLYDHNPIYTALADKLKARIYIANKLLRLGERERERDGFALRG